MKDISIDLETLSTRPDAAILSIGAAEFDRSTGEIGRTFYVEVDLNSAINDGHVDGGTLSWWYTQAADARRLFGNGTVKSSILTALTMLREFVQKAGDDVRPWGNGSSFDITILESAYNRNPAAGAIPWKFWDVRDMRTIVDLASENGFDRNDVPFEGVAHNALDDATHQARVISAAYNAITTKAPADTGI